MPHSSLHNIFHISPSHASLKWASPCFPGSVKKKRKSIHIHHCVVSSLFQDTIIPKQWHLHKDFFGFGAFTLSGVHKCLVQGEILFSFTLVVNFKCILVGFVIQKVFRLDGFWQWNSHLTQYLEHFSLMRHMSTYVLISAELKRCSFLQMVNIS